MTRKLILSITASDCRFDYFKGSGTGGQKKNKTSSAVRCTHIASGAVGQSQDGRSQLHNKQTAFVRMAETTKFKNWLRVETARKLGMEEEVERKVKDAMHPSNIKIEVREDDKWVQVDSLDINLEVRQDNADVLKPAEKAKE